MHLFLQMSKLQETTSYFDENVGRVGVKSDTVICGPSSTVLLFPPKIVRLSYGPGLKVRKKREKSQTFLFTCAGLILLSKVP